MTTTTDVIPTGVQGRTSQYPFVPGSNGFILHYHASSAQLFIRGVAVQIYNHLMKNTPYVFRRIVSAPANEVFLEVTYTKDVHGARPITYTHPIRDVTAETSQQPEPQKLKYSIRLLSMDDGDCTIVDPTHFRAFQNPKKTHLKGTHLDYYIEEDFPYCNIVCKELHSVGQGNRVNLDRYSINHQKRREIVDQLMKILTYMEFQDDKTWQSIFDYKSRLSEDSPVDLQSAVKSTEMILQEILTRLDKIEGKLSS